MNKEVIVAIVIGVSLGIGGALIFGNLKPKHTNQELTVKTANITPKVTTQETQFATFKKLPKDNSIYNEGTIIIAGKADSSVLVFAANLVETKHLPIKNKQFSESLNLKPGLNEIVLYEINGDNDQTQILPIYYFKPNQGKVENEKEEATREADVLKEKLEAEALKLRDEPKQAINGQVKTINDKEISLKVGSNTKKIALEPEITNFYQAQGTELEEVGLGDINKGDTVTVFISEIAGDNISYTVYREPNQELSVGKISNVDENNYQVTILNFDKSTISADIETDTSQRQFNSKTKKTSKAGFSDLQIGRRIITTLFGGENDKSVSAYLIIK